jgi:transcription elongation factor GreA
MELPVMQKLKKELENLRYELKTKLPKELEKARAHGDLSENAEYDAAKERQGYVTARIAQIEQRIRELSLYSVDSIPRGVVAYGSLVTLESLDDGETLTFDIVFPEEVDAAEGRISVGSPMGRALVNKAEGEEIEVHTPKGRRAYQIVELQTLHDRRAPAPR